MMRKPFKPTRLAVPLQAAILVAAAAGVFGILISDISRHRAEVARVEAPSNAHLLVSPHDRDAKPR